MNGMSFLDAIHSIFLVSGLDETISPIRMGLEGLAFVADSDPYLY